MTTKEAILEMIRKPPEYGTVSDVMAELYFRQKVDQGLQELDVGPAPLSEEIICSCRTGGRKYTGVHRKLIEEASLFFHTP